MKRCSSCKIEKDSDEFHRCTRRPDGLQNECKTCRSDRHSRTYAGRTERMRVGRIAYRRRLAAKVAELKQQPCTDCGGSFPACVMDFHHRDASTKVAAIARMIFTSSWPKIEAEIVKCDLLCANCHRIRTHGAVPERLTELPAKQFVVGSSPTSAS
jgi:hypothetical protein